jgi:hypothetical protein
MEEKRRETRDPSTGGVLYSLTSNDSEKTRTGLLSDLSRSGACIYTQECITDEKVRVYFKGVSREPVDADVMWCIRSQEDLFRAGLQFQN